MNSAIVWVLVISMHGGYQSFQVRIPMPSEQVCETARSLARDQFNKPIDPAYSRCRPEKQK